MTPEREGRATRTPQWEAGRALDAEIAETVMGAVWSFASHDVPESAWLQFGGKGWILAYRYAYGRVVYKDTLPAYSTEIASAWLVIENLASRGWKVDVQNRYAPTWGCHVNFPAPDYRKVFTHTNSAALSICLAALEAIGAIPLGSNNFPRSDALSATPQDHTRPLRTE